MIRLLKREWMIWSSSSMFKYGMLAWVLCSFGLPQLLISAGEAKNFNVFPGFKEGFDFPLIVNTISVLGLLPLQIFVVLLITFICNELEFKTSRLHLIHGAGRTTLWLSKVYVSLVFAVLNTLMTLVVSFVFGFKTSGSFESGSLRWIGILCFQSFYFLNIVIFMSFLFKKIETTILVYLVCFGIFEPLTALILDYRLGMYPIFRFLPGKSVNELSHLIMMERITGFKNEYISLRGFFGLLWLSLFSFLSLKMYRKRDF